MKFIALAFLLIGSIAQANSVNLGFGPSLNGSTNPKSAKLGYELDLTDAFSFTASATGIFEPKMIGAFSLVASAKALTPSGMFLRIGFGPGVITSTDDRLSSIPEFNIVYATGLASESVEGGIEGNHWSNAGFFGGPNLGRDSALLFLAFKL